MVSAFRECCRMLSIIAALSTFLLWGSSIKAEDLGVKETAERITAHESIAEAPDFRGRLVDPVRDGATLEPEIDLHSFSWEALTKYGPASGASVQVGNPNKGPYYDFKDGLPHPYYIVGSKR